MKTSTVNGVTYELPDGWEPIETVPANTSVNILDREGKTEWDSTPIVGRAIAWQHIVAPKVVPWKSKMHEKYWCVLNASPMLTDYAWRDDDTDNQCYEVGNCYPTRAAAEAARERVIAAHNGGAKWKGGCVMGDTFKAVEGWTTERETKGIANSGDYGTVFSSKILEQDIPCTIIPGHWVDRLESGQLLTAEEWDEARNEYDALQPLCAFGDYLLVFVARKLRGEA